MPQQLAKRRRKGANTKKRHRKKMRRRLAKRVYPLPASHFRCRFVLRENILLNCNIFNCKLLLFLIKEFFVLSVFACVCLSFGGANRAPESACTFGVIASPTCIKTSTRLNANYILLQRLLVINQILNILF